MTPLNVPNVLTTDNADLRAMAAAVDTLIVTLPDTATTRLMIDAEVLGALGSDGVLINVGRGSVVDEPALIAALRNGTILAAGLDVFAEEPIVPDALVALSNAVLLPHVGSASVYTRDAMGELVVENLTRWFERGEPVTPVPETPLPRAGRTADQDCGGTTPLRIQRLP